MKRTNPSMTRPSFRWLSHLPVKTRMAIGFARPAWLVRRLVLLIACGWISASVLFGQKNNIVVLLDLSQIQLGLKHGGRASTIAVHPEDSKLILVTSESGGLFRTENGGKLWERIDDVPFRLASVVFLPDQPNVALLTALEDFQAGSGGGGVWRSTDSGKTWIQTPTPPGVDRGRLSAYEISVAPDTGAIYVGHASGILVSQNDLGKTWKHISVFKDQSILQRSVYSIVALAKKTVIAGGPGGVRRSANGGSDWSADITDKDKNKIVVRDLHAFHHSNASPGQAYLVDGVGQIFVTEDSGLTWTPIKKAIGFDGAAGSLSCNRDDCGGMRFIKATRPAEVIAQHVDLYHGNRCCTFRMRCPQKSSGSGFDYSGKWEFVAVDHSDPRDIAFNHDGDPILMATDGGLHKTVPSSNVKKHIGSNWVFTGGGKSGYNALQITEIRGQYVDEAGNHDFYFGTQDNGFWSSGDGGATWKMGMGSEGAFIQAEARVASVANAKITYESGTEGDLFIADRLFAARQKWTNPHPKLKGAGPPVIIRDQEYVQPAIAKVAPGESGAAAMGFRLERTLNRGQEWKPFVKFDSEMELRDLPKLAAVGNKSSPTILYQAIRIPGNQKPGKEKIRLARIVKKAGEQLGQVFYPAMDNFAALGKNLTGAIGLTKTSLAVYAVYAVDPGDPLHVIAADVGGTAEVKQKSATKPPGMMETRDGGETWDEMTSLTEFVTDHGTFLFMRPDDPSNPEWRSMPIVGAIAFSPQDPNLVLLGTSETGLYLSTDNGRLWQRIEGSERVTNVSAIHWVSANEAVVSTYGRGLWRVRYEVHIESGPEDPLCDGCFFVPVDVPHPNPIDQGHIERGVLIFDGKVMGATVESGVLREVFVTPGSSVAFVSSEARALGIRVTRTNTRMGYRGVRNAPPLSRSGRITRGLLFDERMRLQGAVFAARPASMFTPKAITDVGGRTVSPAAGHANLRVFTNRFAGLPATPPDEPVQISGSNFPPGSNLQFLIDEQPTSLRTKVNLRGTFATQFPAPRELGMHSVQIRDAGSGEVLDGSLFLVTHAEVAGPRLRPKKR